MPARPARTAAKSVAALSKPKQSTVEALLSTTKRRGKASDNSDLNKRPELESIAKLYHLPLCEAARQMNMCTTTFKLLCRERGISRWPYKRPHHKSEIDMARVRELASIEAQHMVRHEAMVQYADYVE
jgi:hypothetical protein